MELSAFWFCCVLLLSAGSLFKADRTAHNVTTHLTRVSEAPTGENELDIELLRVGRPLVGVVEEGESRLLHFGVLPRGEKFPDILLYLDAVDSNAKIDIYCVPYVHINAAYPPDRISAKWKTTKYEDVFISSKSISYQEAIGNRVRNGKKTKMATFGCAIHGSSKGSSDFQLTLRLSFDETKLNPEQEDALKQIHKDCCSDNNTCHRWMQNEQKASKKRDQLKEVEYDFCHRSGSLCNAKGDIIRLDMSSFGLKCALPVDSLQKLTSLEVLDLSDNSIHADIAEDVVQLRDIGNLKELRLAHNLIFGEMAVPDFCSHLPSNLRVINLDGNFITGSIPSCLFSTSRLLEEVYLSDNRFSGYISNVFTPLSPLKALTLSNNGLAGSLPPTLGRLQFLKVLHLDGNEFNGKVPEEFTGMKSIEVLDLSNNRLSSLPSSWSTAWNPPVTLRVIKLQHNKLSDSLPTRLLRATSLEWLDMSANSLSGHLFARRGMFPNMIYFNVSGNHLIGSIPEEFSSLGLFGNKTSNGPRHIFDVSFNHLSGSLPEFFYQEETPSIVETEIYLEGNRLTCHRWKTLNNVPNFDCKSGASAGHVGAHDTAKILHDESDQRDLVYSLEGTSSVGGYPTNNANNAQLHGSGGSSGGNSANGIIGAVSGILGAVVLIGIIVLIFRFRRRRARRLGLQYGAADEDDSDDDIVENIHRDSESSNPSEMV